MQAFGCIGRQRTLFFHVDVGDWRLFVIQCLAERRADADQQVFAVDVHDAEQLGFPHGIIRRGASDLGIARHQLASRQ